MPAVGHSIAVARRCSPGNPAWCKQGAKKHSQCSGQVESAEKWWACAKIALKTKQLNLCSQVMASLLGIISQYFSIAVVIFSPVAYSYLIACAVVHLCILPSQQSSAVCEVSRPLVQTPGLEKQRSVADVIRAGISKTAVAENWGERDMEASFLSVLNHPIFWLFMVPSDLKKKRFSDTVSPWKGDLCVH